MTHLVDPSFWDVVFPNYLGATGAIAAALVALVAYWKSRRNAGGLRSIQAGLNEAQGTVTVATGDGTMTTVGTQHVFVTWGVQHGGGSRYTLTNRSPTHSAHLTTAEDISPDGDNAFQILLELPVDISPGGSVPFLIEKTLVSPAVTAIHVAWEEDGREPQSQTLYV